MNVGYYDKQIVRNALTNEKKNTHQLPVELGQMLQDLYVMVTRKICEKVCNYRFPMVGVMGSESDWKTMQKAVDILAKFDIPYEVLVVSAHRTQIDCCRYALMREQGDFGDYCRAGGAAHLPGMLASKSVVPVFGMQIETII